MLDNEIQAKLRQIIKELDNWAEKAERNKLSRADIDRMKNEANALRLMLSLKEI